MTHIRDQIAAAVARTAGSAVPWHTALTAADEILALIAGQGEEPTDEELAATVGFRGLKVAGATAQRYRAIYRAAYARGIARGEAERAELTHKLVHAQVLQTAFPATEAEARRIRDLETLLKNEAECYRQSAELVARLESEKAELQRRLDEANQWANVWNNGLREAADILEPQGGPAETLSTIVIRGAKRLTTERDSLRAELAAQHEVSFNSDVALRGQLKTARAELDRLRANPYVAAHNLIINEAIRERTEYGSTKRGDSLAYAASWLAAQSPPAAEPPKPIATSPFREVAEASGKPWLADSLRGIEAEAANWPEWKRKAAEAEFPMGAEPQPDPEAKARERLGKWLVELFPVRGEVVRAEKHSGLKSADRYRVELRRSARVTVGPWSGSWAEAINAALDAAEQATGGKAEKCVGSVTSTCRFGTNGEPWL